ncbi:MAG: aminotransferase class I/II-fold pyridoxal phosphate-dependent enzyme [Chloroflexi bacterium]|nr:aminotransferase class I/II-fold pyridoxal phosphate-dependent enzyme [Chloroflexota bacterium]
MSDLPHWEQDTIAARGGRGLPPSVNQPKAAPIVQSAVYTFSDLEQIDRVLTGREAGYFYGRFGSPNQTALEGALAELEGAAEALVTSSGMSAITVTLLSLLSAGDHLVAGEELYGGTLVLLRDVLPRFGITTTLADAANPAAMTAAMTPRTKAVLVETISNPTLRLVDLHALATVAHQRGALLLVDNTLATPILCRPLEFGADVAIHSITKYLAGHDDVVAGVTLGPAGVIAGCRALNTLMGATLGPFDAWLALRGVKTLAIRMRQIGRTAQTLAERLAASPKVQRVIYPGLPAHPQHALGRELLPHGAGGILSFELAGGRPTVARFLAALEGIPLAPSLGGVATTITHPAGSTHRGLSPEERARLGISEGLLRLSVGIEDPTDLTEALQRALEAV